MGCQDSDSKREKTSPQRKTTLKWGRDGELSSVDMARILEKISNNQLTECDFACDVDQSN